MRNSTKKAELLDNGLYMFYRKIKRSLFCAFNNIPKFNVMPYNQAVLADFLFQKYKPNEYKICRALEDSRVARSKRLSDKIEFMLDNFDCVFLTITFKDKYLYNVNEQTRRKYVQRFLSSLDCYYVANIDFGEKKGREHYHAVVSVNYVNTSLWHYGHCHAESIRSSLDYVKLAKYISKLTNHALKATTQNKRCLFSKKFYDGFKDYIQYENLPIDTTLPAVTCDCCGQEFYRKFINDGYISFYKKVSLMQSIRVNKFLCPHCRELYKQGKLKFDNLTYIP